MPKGETFIEKFKKIWAFRKNLYEKLTFFPYIFKNI